MFIHPIELGTNLAGYQIEQITHGDQNIVISAIDTAIAEVKSYLATRYNVDDIFAKTEEDRSALVVHHVKTLACFHLVELANVDALYERYQMSYNNSIDYLSRLSEGTLVADLPYKETATGNPPGTIQISSNKKFIHSF